MICKKRPNGTPYAWSDLVAELDHWAEARRVATLWWRDDDAVTTTPELERLLALAEGVPLVLAVIPAAAEPELADALAARPDVVVVQHGWRHANHAGEGKKNEFPQRRQPDHVAAELAAGRARLAALFGDAAWPALAPPWNRLDVPFLPLLPQAGIVALSRMAPRAADEPAPPVAEIDVHLDVVGWREGGGFIGEAAALGAIVAELEGHRFGDEAEEPIGLLTHHLVMDDATATFLGRLTALVADHPAVRWAGAAELFSAGARG